MTLSKMKWLALLTYVSLGAISSNASGTADLISKFDDLFDCLNSSSLNSAKTYKKPIRNGSTHIKYITKMIKFIASIKVVDKQTNTDVTNQLRFFDNYLTPLPSGNCAKDLDNILVGSTVTTRIGHAINNDLPTSTSPFNLNDSDYKMQEIEQNMLRMNALTYVAGYLLRKCPEKHPCDQCRETLQAKELTSSSQLFCHFKAFDTTSSFGSLTVPQDNFVSYVSTIDIKFVK